MLPGKAGNERGILATLGVLRLVILLRAQIQGKDRLQTPRGQSQIFMDG